MSNTSGIVRNNINESNNLEISKALTSKDISTINSELPATGEQPDILLVIIAILILPMSGFVFLNKNNSTNVE